MNINDLKQNASNAAAIYLECHINMAFIQVGGDRGWNAAHYEAIWQALNGPPEAIALYFGTLVQSDPRFPGLDSPSPVKFGMEMFWELVDWEIVYRQLMKYQLIAWRAYQYQSCVEQGSLQGAQWKDTYKLCMNTINGKASS